MRTSGEKAHTQSKRYKVCKELFKVKNIKYWHILSILTPHLKFLGKPLNFIDKILTKIPLSEIDGMDFYF